MNTPDRHNAELRTFLEGGRDAGAFLLAWWRPTLHWNFMTVRFAGTTIWEKDLGVTMGTLNNPGWRLDVRRV